MAVEPTPQNDPAASTAPGSAHNSATGLSGGVVQAGSIHGDVHVHGGPDARPGPVPRQLLPPPRHFTNRDREQATLDDILSGSGASSRVVLLRGAGGVGKTALALAWLADHADRFPDGALYAELATANGTPVAPEEVLGEFLRALGVAQDQVPAGLAERTALFRSLTAGLAVCALLDDAVSAAQVRVLLPTSPSAAVLVTSRRPLLGLLAAGIEELRIEPLDHDAAVELLARRLGPERVAAEREPVQALVRLCGGWPIALVVVAALTIARPRRPLSRTVADLRDGRRRLAVLSVDEEVSVRSVFDVSYLSLSEPARRAYRTLSRHPGPTFTVRSLAAALASDVGDADDAVTELLDASLVEDLGDDRFRLHDLIRWHADDRAGVHDDPAARDAAARRVVEWYLRAARTANEVVLPARRVPPHEYGPPTAMAALPPGLDRYATALHWLERERHGLAAAVREAADRRWPRLAFLVADALQPLLIMRKHDRLAVEVSETALRAVLVDGDPAAETELREQLGRRYAKLGDVARAEEHIAELLRAGRTRGDRRAEANAMATRARLLAGQGNRTGAAEAYGRTVAILDALDEPRELALALTALGSVLSELGRHAEATERLTRARSILVGLSEQDPYDESRVTIALAHNHVREGDLDAAAAMIPAALATIRRFESAYERARAHRLLAELHQRTGNSAEARRSEQVASDLIREIDQDDET